MSLPDFSLGLCWFGTCTSLDLPLEHSLRVDSTLNSHYVIRKHEDCGWSRGHVSPELLLYLPSPNQPKETLKLSLTKVEFYIYWSRELSQLSIILSSPKVNQWEDKFICFSTFRQALIKKLTKACMVKKVPVLYLTEEKVLCTQEFVIGIHAVENQFRPYSHILLLWDFL
jgi:hypothetical protein